MLKLYSSTFFACVFAGLNKMESRYSNPMNSEYQSVYNVGLLDDLHNYFPGLLYQMERFQTLPQVFQYVRQQMNSRFNLYNYGASLAGVASAPAAPMPHSRFIPMRRARMPVPAQAAPRRDAELFTLASLFTQIPSDIWTANPVGFENVVVGASAEVVAQTTDLIAGSTLTEGSLCSICQDSIIPTDSARKLRACNHVYHQVCIDQWFERSVFCPTCRHDVREN